MREQDSSPCPLPGPAACWIQLAHRNQAAEAPWRIIGARLIFRRQPDFTASDKSGRENQLN